MNPDTSFIIGIHNVPPKWSLKQLIQKLTPIMKRPFTALRFDQQKGMRQSKVAFLRFSSTVSQDLVLAKMRNIIVKSGKQTYCMFAFIPTNVSQEILHAKGKGQNKKMAHKFGIVTERPEVTCTRALYELLRELQMKFTKLHNLSAVTGHRLLDDIAHIMFERMALLIKEKNKKKIVTMTNYSMTKTYRSEHPHHSDFQMIMSTLHRIEDEVGRPRTQLTKNELTSLPTLNQIVNPHSGPMLKAATTKIMCPIINKVLQHIRQLDTNGPPQPTAEQRAALQVRIELKKQEPYVAEIIRDTVLKDVMPRQGPGLYKRVKIFGEPFMPARETVMPALSQIRPYCQQVRRCMRLYNCLLLNVQTQFYPQFLKLDGTRIGAATLVCRPSEMPIHGIPESVLEKIKAFYGLASKPAQPRDEPTEQAQSGGTGQTEEWGQGEGAELMEDMEYLAEDIDFDEIDADVEGEASWA